MLTIRELIKTLYNAFNQKLKNHRGNWEQNDPTADDYIKNRPFYVGDTKEIILVDNYTDNGVTPKCNFVVGQAYNVIWNGTLYENVVCKEEDGYNALTGDDYPFYIDDDGGNDFYVSGDFSSISISKLEEDIHKLDKKFIDLPDGIITEDDLAPVATSGSYYDLSDTPTIYSDVVRYGTSQSLTDAQKNIARTNITAVGYESQTLTDSQKIQARANIGAVSSEDITGVVKYSTTQSLTDAQKEVARTNIGAADEVKVEELITSAKNGILLMDEIKNYPYVVTMRDGSLVTYCATKSVEVTTMPIKTEYMHGEYFDATGMVVTATCYDDTTREIIDFTYPTTYLAEGATSVEITYIEAGVAITTIIPIVVGTFDAETILIDFTYTDNGNGTYTLTGWKGTYNGEASTEIIVPNNACIIV